MVTENLPKFKGSGIIYCMTMQDTERVANWLQKKGFSAKPYHAGKSKNSEEEIDRPSLENALIDNEVKILVATVALGMGFDKPDIEFVIHFQSPGSVIVYYQQVGRAGRAVDRSYGILLSGKEDEEIQKYLINNCFSESESIFRDILSTLEQTDGMSLTEFLPR